MQMATMDQLTISWTTYRDRIEALPESERRGVAALRDMANSYVWGVEDAGGKSRPDASWVFANAYGVHCADFAAGKISCRHPIRDAWESWLADKPIGEYATPAVRA